MQGKSACAVQAVANPKDGLNVVLQPQLAAQAIDMYIHGAAFPNIGIAPCGLHKLAAGECGAAMGYQYGQQGKFLLGQANLLTGAVDMVGGKLNRKIFIRNYS